MPIAFSLEILTKVQDFTYHCKRIFVLRGVTVVFFGLICIFLSPAGCALLQGNLPISGGFALKYTHIMGLTDTTDLKKRKEKNPCLILFHWKFATLCQSVLSEFLLGVTVQCIKTASCKFPEGGGKIVGDGSFYTEPQNCCSAS